MHVLGNDVKIGTKAAMTYSGLGCDDSEQGARDGSVILLGPYESEVGKGWKGDGKLMEIDKGEDGGGYVQG